MEEKKYEIQCEEHQFNQNTRQVKTVQGLSSGSLLDKSVLKDVKISRYVSGPTKLPEMSLTLFQYQTCPFCCKVRAFLDYFGIPYNLVEVNPVLRSQIKFSKYRKVPFIILEKNGEKDLLQLNDSSVIISILGSFLLHNKNSNEDFKSLLKLYNNISVSNDGKVESQVINRYFLMLADTSSEKYKQIEANLNEERKWRQWADDVFVHTLSPNIYRSFGESLQSFKYFSEVGNWKEYFKTWERQLVIYAGASAMLFVGKKLKKKYGLKEDVRLSLYDESNVWLSAIGEQRKFLGGSKPNLADLTVYGMMSSIEGCDAFKDVLNHTNVGDCNMKGDKTPTVAEINSDLIVDYSRKYWSTKNVFDANVIDLIYNDEIKASGFNSRKIMVLEIMEIN
ncbi:prostaglandin E synthase 2-like protein [Leptotrombidium deliense]|uniref:Prostaglandin E synthase 2 n=1 Tax=Leptotrombidium deliense TaxID=299467 RepID=A0A443SCC3_9ACAR|nr:prostaglandin E synthase 2-like protein [Leptotrombidium deliense]